jgi:hypothetical protein
VAIHRSNKGLGKYLKWGAAKNQMRIYSKEHTTDANEEDETYLL